METLKFNTVADLKNWSESRYPGAEVILFENNISDECSKTIYEIEGTNLLFEVLINEPLQFGDNFCKN